MTHRERDLLATLLLIFLLLLLSSPACTSGGGGGGGGSAGSGDPDPCAGQPQDQCDSDGDGVVNASDLCRSLADPDSCDSDADGYGNACDCDLDQDGVCDAADQAAFDAELGLPGFAAADMDCDADVDADDATLFDQAMAEGAPGPSGLPCAGSSPCPDPGYDFPGSQWATDTPLAQGVDPVLLQDALDYLASVSGDEGVDRTMVTVRGRSIWEGPDVHVVGNLLSVTKSFTATALGVLLGEGLASYDTLAADHLPELATDYPTVDLRHFVTHGSGYDAVGGAGSDQPFDVGTPTFTPPGTAFLYWDAAINELANVLTQIAGESLQELLEREVTGPIGMSGWYWGDFGYHDGLLVNGGGGNNGEGVKSDARTLARLCHLHLARGSWDGVQVLPSEWIDNATRTRVPYTVPNLGGGIGPGTYGHGWFANGYVDADTRLWPDAPAGAYMAAGYRHNRCWIVPEWHMVITHVGGSTSDNYTPAEENEFLRRMGLAIQ